MSNPLLRYFCRILLVTQLLVNAVLYSEPVLLGIDVLEKNHFQLLKGKKIGLLTHPAASTDMAYQP